MSDRIQRLSCTKEFVLNALHAAIEIANANDPELAGHNPRIVTVKNVAGESQYAVRGPGLPPDTVFHDIYFDPSDQIYHIICSSDKFYTHHDGDTPYYHELYQYKYIKDFFSRLKEMEFKLR